MTRHLGVIAEDGGECLPEWDNNNSHATRYIQRVVNKKNLEASNDFFARFVEEVHRRGMKIILDGVFNHCGSFNNGWTGSFCMNTRKAMKKEPISPRTVRTGLSSGLTMSMTGRIMNFMRAGGGHDTLPKLNYEESPQLVEYILGVAKKWQLPPYNVDGWRLDVAADLGFSEEYNHEFWRKFRKAVKEVNPDALILAEYYGNAKKWLLGDQWDTIMNYDAFMEPVTWFLDRYGKAQRRLPGRYCTATPRRSCGP